jgi:hypothetical protein
MYYKSNYELLQSYNSLHVANLNNILARTQGEVPFQILLHSRILNNKYELISFCLQPSELNDIFNFVKKKKKYFFSHILVVKMGFALYGTQKQSTKFSSILINID